MPTTASVPGAARRASTPERREAREISSPRYPASSSIPCEALWKAIRKSDFARVIDPKSDRLSREDHDVTADIRPPRPCRPGTSGLASGGRNGKVGQIHRGRPVVYGRFCKKPAGEPGHGMRVMLESPEDAHHARGKVGPTLAEVKARGAGHRGRGASYAIRLPSSPRESGPPHGGRLPSLRDPASGPVRALARLSGNRTAWPRAGWAAPGRAAQAASPAEASAWRW
jgi:hypothetical protein